MANLAKVRGAKLQGLFQILGGSQLLTMLYIAIVLLPEGGSIFLASGEKIWNNSVNGQLVSGDDFNSHSLGFHVLAEYISTEELRDYMAQLGCILYQGWLCAPALTLEERKNAYGVKTTKKCFVKRTEASQCSIPQNSGNDQVLWRGREWLQNVQS